MHCRLQKSYRIPFRDGKFSSRSPARPKIQDKPGFLRSSNQVCRAHPRFGGSNRNVLCIGFVRYLKAAGRARCWAQKICRHASLGSTFGEIFSSHIIRSYDVLRQAALVDERASQTTEDHDRQSQTTADQQQLSVSRQFASTD